LREKFKDNMSRIIVRAGGECDVVVTVSRDG
jgi:hypothetical protein